jgi:hypothetical protein
MSAYVPTDWVDGDTPVNAANLDKLEQGLAAASQDALGALAGNPPDPTSQPDGKWLTTAGGAMVWADAPAGGGGIEYENVWSAVVPYDAGDVVRYNGIDYLAVNPSTGQEPPAALPASIPLVTALPGAPVDGQEVILVDVIGAATYSWRLRYVAARASNRWIFVGGSPLLTERTTSGTRTSTAYGDLNDAANAPAITIPVAGDYHVETGAYMEISALALAYMSFAIGAVAAADAEAAIVIGNSVNEGGTVYRKQRKNALAAGTVLAAKYKSTGGTVTSYNRMIAASPVAVGG